jgi:hypothetical protein
MALLSGTGIGLKPQAAKLAATTPHSTTRIAQVMAHSSIAFDLPRTCARSPYQTHLRQYLYYLPPEWVDL